MFQRNDYPTLTDYARNLLLEWSRQDPVSQKEIDRNEGVYKFQHNRNPFIDFPLSESLSKSHSELREYKLNRPYR